MEINQIRVLFVCNILSVGGAEKFVSNALSLLNRTQLDLHLALFRDEIVYDIPNDIPVHILHKYNRTDIPKAIWNLKLLIDKLRPSVVISPHSGINQIVGEALRLCSSKPYWIARIAVDPDHEDKGIYGIWSRRVHNKADMLLINSEALRPIVERHFPSTAGHIRRLYNPTDFARIDQQASQQSRFEIAGQKPVIVAAGRLEPVKRFDLLLDAFALVREKFDCQLIVLGEGSLRQVLEEKIKKLDIADDVTLPGFLSNPYPVMANADIFVLSSDSEGLPNVVIEAQGLGVPVVATDCPTGPAEIIDHGRSGVLVPPGNAQLLAHAVTELLSDDEKRACMSAAARETARSRFDAPKLISSLTDFILEGNDFSQTTSHAATPSHRAEK